MVAITYGTERKECRRCNRLQCCQEPSTRHAWIGKPQIIAKLSQRSVGCIYYAFPSPAPLEEPILILNGEGGDRRNTKDFPVNNICFPSVVQTSYAPYEFRCVSILVGAIAEHYGNESTLDTSV